MLTSLRHTFGNNCIRALLGVCEHVDVWELGDVWAKIPSVTDASAPRFHQCSPNYKYQQLLSFMAV